MKRNFVSCVFCFLIVATGETKDVETLLKLDAEKDLREQAEDYLTIDNTNFIKLESETIELNCNTKYLKAWRGEFPTGNLKWLKNGKSFELDASRMFNEDQVLTISNLQPSDTGVYLCQWEFVIQTIKRKGLFGTKKKALLRTPTVGVFSIAVRSKKPLINTRAGLSVELDCHGATLGALLNKTNQRWYLNGKVVIDYKSTPPQDVEKQTIEVKPGMAGEWTCVITHTPTMKYWVTACFLMTVGPSLSIWEKMIRQPFYLICFVLAVAFIAAIPIMLLMGRFQSKHKEAQAQYEKFKDKFGDGKSPFVGDTDDENEEYKDGASSEEEEEEEGEEENEEEMETYEVAHTPAFNRDVNQINSVPVNGAFTGLNDILTRAFQPNDNNAGFNIQNFFQGATHRPQSPLEEEVIPKDSPTRLPPIQSLHRQNTSSLIEAEETGYAQHPGEMPMSVSSASTFAADTSIYSQISPEASLFNLRTPRVSQNVVQNPMHNYYQNEVTSHSQIDSVGGYPEPENSRAPSYVSMSAGSESRNQFPPPLTPGRSPIENMLRKRLELTGPPFHPGEQ